MPLVKNEMAISGSVLRRPNKDPKLVRIVAGPTNDLVGTGFVCKLAGKTLLMTAHHVHEVCLSLDDVRFVGTDGIAISMGSRKPAYMAPLLDQVGYEISNTEQSRLGVSTLQIAMPQHGPIRVYTPTQDGFMVAHGEVRAVGTARLDYTASTKEGASGGPIMQGTKVIGVHKGAALREGVNTGYLIPTFLFERSKDESPTAYGIVRFATDVDAAATREVVVLYDEEFDFALNPDGTIALGHSWADEMDDVDLRRKARPVLEETAKAGFPSPAPSEGGSPGLASPSTTGSQPKSRSFPGVELLQREEVMQAILNLDESRVQELQNLLLQVKSPSPYKPPHVKSQA